MLLTIAALLASQTAQPPQVVAPPPPPPTPGQNGPQIQPSPAFMASAEAFSQCVEAGAGALPATVTPEAGAQTVIAGCQAQVTEMRTQFHAWVDAEAGFPAEAKPMIKSQFDARFDSEARTRVAEGIRQARAGGTPPAPPAR